MESEKGVYEWVKRIVSCAEAGPCQLLTDRTLRAQGIYGFSLVSGIPPTPEATEALIRRIAFIRETHYGGFWDFTADLKHGDLAYSDVLLQGHTDTTYFTDVRLLMSVLRCSAIADDLFFNAQPCGLQLFHLLSPSTSHKGGHNLVVDGFRAAAIFRERHPSLYSLFSTLPIPSHASGSGSDSVPSGVHMRPLTKKPVFNHDERGELVQVRWNGDDRGVVGGEGFEAEGVMEAWFEGLRAWEGILRSEEATLWSEMEMGTAVSESGRLPVRTPTAEADRLRPPLLLAQSLTTTAFCTAVRLSRASDGFAAPTSTTTTSARAWPGWRCSLGRRGPRGSGCCRSMA